jgi:uracil phosphoribosyltransferase
MCATGGSVAHAIDVLKKVGCQDINYRGIVGSPIGVATVQKAHPDVNIFLAALDENLNEVGYIVPGLGDCGDRLFGTK